VRKGSGEGFRSSKGRGQERGGKREKEGRKEEFKRSLAPVASEKLPNKVCGDGAIQ